MSKTIWVIAFLFFSLSLALAQDGNGLSIVGTWNVTATQDSKISFIAVETFHLGGTMVHIDTAGTNPSASPGESIDLGVWRATTNDNYRYKIQNYIFNALGNLAVLAVGKCNVTVATPPTTFTGSCSLSFYRCSLNQCPGSLLSGPISVQIAARRF